MSLLSRLAVQAARAYGILSSNPNNVSASYLVVAGGGAGGSVASSTGAGGGAGAGGFKTSTFTLSTLNTYSIAVGAGGSAVANLNGATGSNSAISGTGLTTVTSLGGGGGGFGGGGSTSTGSSGGSGGGGGFSTTSSVAGTGTSGQGNNGGVGQTGNPYGGGGGGGASAAGSNAATNGGAGGAGTASSISGSSVTYSGGGGGGSNNSGGTGGSGGGGNGGSASSNGSAGTANTGGGGGGAGNSGSAQTGGAGGSGIVIISYTSATPKFVGGTLTTSGGKQIHTFTSSGTLSPITPITASYLVVAGGGGAGAANGGGGGAGGFLASSTTIYSGATYVVTVGAGGSGGQHATGTGATNGGNSVLSGTGITTVTSTGGGRGGSYAEAAASGGSGGGASNGTNTGGTGTSGQGNNGGSTTSTSTGNFAATGGGGAGAAGASLTGNGNATNGGIGLTSSITGTSTYYAGGGGGGANGGSNSSGGLGGGGAGAVNNPGTSGTANTGGGGGGSAGSNNGALGGSGIVIISYAGSQAFNGGLVTSSGGNTIHTFTSTGALTPLTNNLNNSLRFRSSASAYLSRTPTLATNRRTWTLSMWIKRGGNFGSQSEFFTAGTSGTNYLTFQFDASNRLALVSEVPTTVCNLRTTSVYRDPAAWYHITLSVDTTQATAANRVKLYVNGNQLSAFDTATYPSQNTDLLVNSAVAHYFSHNTSGGGYFDGYDSDIYFIDGQALEPYYFGNNDANGVWKPILYKGTYGTNGFYLTFGNTTSTTTLGYDSSPNGNNWTTNNISLTAGTTYDAMTDVPTNTSATVANYATWNPLQKYSGLSAPTNGNLTIAGNSANWRSILSTFAVSSGKWYCEIVMTSVSSDALTGIFNINSASDLYDLTTVDNRQLARYAGGYGYQNNGNKVNNNTATSYGSTYTTSDIVGIAFDLDNGKIWFSKNGTWQASGDPAAGTNAAYTGLSGLFAVGMSTANGTFDANFGQRPFAYTPPTGFVALNTFNL